MKKVFLISVIILSTFLFFKFTYAMSQPNDSDFYSISGYNYHFPCQTFPANFSLSVSTSTPQTIIFEASQTSVYSNLTPSLCLIGANGLGCDTSDAISNVNVPNTGVKTIFSFEFPADQNDINLAVAVNSTSITPKGFCYNLSNQSSDIKIYGTTQNLVSNSQSWNILLNAPYPTLQDLYFSFSDNMMLSLTFPENYSSTTDFEGFIVDYTIPNLSNYLGMTYYVCYGTNAVEVADCNDSRENANDLSFRIVRQSASAIDLSLSGGPMIIRKDLTLPTGTYYARAAVYGVKMNDFKKVLMELDDTKSFEIIGGNKIYNVSLPFHNIPISGNLIESLASTSGAAALAAIQHRIATSTCESLSLTDLSPVICYISNGLKTLYNDVGDIISGLILGLGDQIKNVFPLNIFFHLSDDINMASINNASTTDVVLSGENLFGGRNYTILTSSTMTNITNNFGGGIDFRDLGDKIMYLGTSLIIIIQTLASIKHFKNSSLSLSQ